MDFIQELGIKDLEHVVLKAKNDMSLGDRTFEAGEPVLYFQNIQIAVLSEQTRMIAARGGYLNQPRVVWEDRNETTFQFSNGTLNPLSMNMLLEANVLRQDARRIPCHETVTVQTDGKIYLSHEPDYKRKRFYYTLAAENIQKRMRPVEENGKVITFGKEFSDVALLADYYFKPQEIPLSYVMDRERKTNLYTLEGTFYLKDENEGLLHTGILEMPKIYIMSNINLRMGERADPTVGTFRIVAMPENVDDHEAMICRIDYLDEDIYGI